MKGRPRTPTKVLKMRGAFDKHPERARARAGEPEVREPLGDPPQTFDESHAARWLDCRAWWPWLSIADRVQIELIVRLWVKLSGGDTKAAAPLNAALAKVGANPSDRSRINAGGPTDRRDPAEAYFGS